MPASISSQVHYRPMGMLSLCVGDDGLSNKRTKSVQPSYLCGFNFVSNRENKNDGPAIGRAKRDGQSERDDQNRKDFGNTCFLLFLTLSRIL